MLSSNNIKNILTTLFNKAKQEHDEEFNHLETRMNEGWIASGTIENIRGNSFESDILYEGNISSVGEYTLSKSILDYDLIGVEHIYAVDDEATQTNWYYTKSINSKSYITCNYGNDALNRCINFILNDDKLTVTYTSGEIINKVIGLKNTNININMYDSTHYSEEELLIGQWIDGKPIYRKVYTNIKPGVWNTFNKIADTTDLNIDNLIEIKTKTNLSHSWGIIYGNWANTPGGYNKISFGYLPDQNYIYEYHANDTLNDCVVDVLIIEYTKTTDTPYSVDEDIAWVALDSEVTDVLNNIGV